MNSEIVDPDDRAAALRMVRVSHETLAVLDAFAALLLRWQRAVQLISPTTIPRLWTRHITDSLQLLQHIPDETKIVADLGAGGGFPGLILAIAFREKKGTMVHLVESDTRKAAFLRESIRTLHLPASVHAERIESAAKRIGAVDLVTARALAPLKALFALAEPFMSEKTLGLFLKGQDVDKELTEAAKSWNIRSKVVPSLTDPTGKILIVQGLNKAAP